MEVFKCSSPYSNLYVTLLLLSAFKPPTIGVALLLVSTLPPSTISAALHFVSAPMPEAIIGTLLFATVPVPVAVAFHDVLEEDHSATESAERVRD
jgi:hypothetical protein